jgi:hypothetical protein
MELFQQNWALIGSNFWVFASVAVLFFGLGWGAARLLYRERLEILKAKAESQKPKTAILTGGSSFVYAVNGRHGRNLLSRATYEVRVNESTSLRAEIPDQSRLHLVLRGLPPAYIEDTSGGWAYSVAGVTNWVAGDYHQDMQKAEQHFDAESGTAELKLYLYRQGDLTIEAYEGTDQRPTWSKVVKIKPAAQSA